jgi:signal transduction histidine kinase
MPENLFRVLKENRDELIRSWTQAVATSLAPAPLRRGELTDRMPHFIDEMICALHPEALPLPPSSGNAEEHGAQRFRMGFDVAEVAREYGLLHQCILDVAEKNAAEVTIRDEQIVAKWINAGLTEAIVQYVSQRDAETERQASEHLGFIAHELRNPLGAALSAFRRLRRRELEHGGRWVDTVERNLVRTSELIDNTLNQVALKAGVELRPAPIDLGELGRDIQHDLDAEATAKAIQIVMSTEPQLTIDADPRLLRSAIANLLQNALKFSHEGSKVSVAAKRRDDRVVIEVADACGGLPPGRAEELFTPFVQRATNRTGYGLGLAIALQAAQAHNGTVTVKNVPDVGCVFTIDLPATRA